MDEEKSQADISCALGSLVKSDSPIKNSDGKDLKSSSALNADPDSAILIESVNENHSLHDSPPPKKAKYNPLHENNEVRLKIGETSSMGTKEARYI